MRMREIINKGFTFLIVASCLIMTLSHMVVDQVSCSCIVGIVSWTPGDVQLNKLTVLTRKCAVDYDNTACRRSDIRYRPIE